MALTIIVKVPAFLGVEGGKRRESGTAAGCKHHSACSTVTAQSQHSHSACSTVTAQSHSQSQSQSQSKRRASGTAAGCKHTQHAITTNAKKRKEKKRKARRVCGGEVCGGEPGAEVVKIKPKPRTPVGRVGRVCAIRGYIIEAIPKTTRIGHSIGSQQFSIQSARTTQTMTEHVTRRAGCMRRWAGACGAAGMQQMNR